VAGVVLSALAVGLAAGMLSGLLGVGGGIVIVPLLATVVGLSQHRAHATSLAAIIPIAAVGAVAFAVEGNVDYGIGTLLAIGTLVGAPLGARVMARAGEGPLKLMFGFLMLVVATQLLLT
jgi:uncharacterized membrane protein YfcA